MSYYVKLFNWALDAIRNPKIIDARLDAEFDAIATASASQREILTAARTYYVRTDGSDSNTGQADTAGGAFLTVQKAIDVSLALDPNGYDVAILVRSGTRTEAIVIDHPLFDGSELFIQGDLTTPSNCVFNVTSATAVLLTNESNLAIAGFKYTTATSGPIFDVFSGSHLRVYGKMEYGAAVGGVFNIGVNGDVSVFADYTVSGNALFNIHAAAPGSNFTTSAITVTHTGTPAYAAYFAGASFSGGVDLRNVTFSGAATGPRFVVHQNSTLAPPSASLTALPGNSAGTEGSGGVYYMSETAINHSLDIVGNVTITGTATVGLAGTGTGSVKLAGTTSGTITVTPQAAAGTYNWNLPTTAGTAGDLLVSGGGGATAMTWRTAIYGTFYKSSNQSYTASSPAKVLIDTAETNQGLTFDGVTNNRVTIVTAGRYWVACQTYATGGTADDLITSRVKLNGTTDIVIALVSATSATVQGAAAASKVYNFAANDYIELYHSCVSNQTIVGASNLTFMSLHYIGP